MVLKLVAYAKQTSEFLDHELVSQKVVEMTLGFQILQLLVYMADRFVDDKGYVNHY